MFNKTRPFRVGGSGFTSFWWNAQVIGFAQMVSHQAPQPVAAPVAIQPLDQQYPMAIITPAAIGAGTLQVQLFEMYGTKVWDNIMRITDTTTSASNPGASFGSQGTQTNESNEPQYNDLSEVFLRLAALNIGVTASKIVYPPNTGVRGGPAVKHYADQYHNIVITDIRDDEQIEIGTMEVLKNMTLMYTHMTRVKETG